MFQNQQYSIGDVEMCAYQPIFSLLPIDLTIWRSKSVLSRYCKLNVRCYNYSRMLSMYRYIDLSLYRCIALFAWQVVYEKRGLPKESLHQLILPQLKVRDRIFKLLRSPRIDSKEPTPPVRQLFSYSVPSLHILFLKIPAQLSSYIVLNDSVSHWYLLSLC